jgi:hypothetical protein
MKMEKIDRSKLKIKNLIGIIDNPTHEDLLFEIVEFLENERRFDGEFIKQEVKDKTRCRIEQDVEDDLQVLCDLGYIEKGKWTKYIVKKHPWHPKEKK